MQQSALREYNQIEYTAMTELNWTELDSVTTIWVEAPGPLRAGLLFRTGRADETLTTAGQTHLIEHLTLSSIHDPSQQHNGFVGEIITGFLVMGQPQEVSDFLAKVCDTIQSLPGDRLESEKQVLAAESATRRYDFRSNLLVWRYGAGGYGLTGMPEFGLQVITLQQLRDYSVQRFTKENAILWLSGPPPVGLHLRLPHGIKQPPPPLAPIQWTFPSWFVDDVCGGIAAGATVPRVSASTIFCEIASKRLRERLRMAKAVSYAPAVIYDHLDAETAHLILYADSAREHRTELVTLFGEVFEELGKIDDLEVDRARQQVHEHWVGSLAPPLADRLMVEAQRAAMDWLFGRELESIESIATEMLSVTASDVSKFWRDAQSTTLFALPSGIRLQPWMGRQIPPCKVPTVQGQKVASLDAPIQQEHLVYGLDGVSVVWPNGSHFTVRYSQLAGALHYEDGCRCLIGFDATTLMIEPTLWHNGQSVCRRIREQIPRDLLLRQQPRPTSAIPKPKTTAWQRFQARLTQR